MFCRTMDMNKDFDISLSAMFLLILCLFRGGGGGCWINKLVITNSSVLCVGFHPPPPPLHDLLYVCHTYFHQTMYLF